MLIERLRRRMTPASSEGGFTLIELLVVILIIGILAAIAIPSFIGQRYKANDASAKSAARTAQTAMETFYTDTQTYVGGSVDALKVIEPSLGETKDNIVTTSDLSPDGYTVTAENQKTHNKFSIKRTVTGTERSCVSAQEGKGGCAAGGKW